MQGLHGRLWKERGERAQSANDSEFPRSARRAREPILAECRPAAEQPASCPQRKVRKLERVCAWRKKSTRCACLRKGPSDALLDGAEYDATRSRLLESSRAMKRNADGHVFFFLGSLEEHMKKFILVFVFAAIAWPFSAQLATARTATSASTPAQAPKVSEIARWDREAANVAIVRDDWVSRTSTARRMPTRCSA